MLHGANLPYKLWAETWETAHYLYTKGLVKALVQDKLTPEEAFFRKKLKLHHLCAFRCIAYTQVPKKLQKKLEPNSKKLILVGYSKTTKGYHLWDPTTDKITVS